MNTKQESFAEAFRSNCGGCRRTCECGREFYNPDGGWTWETGELEGLELRKATALDYTVTTVGFEGKELVMDCDCWHPRAKQIMSFLDGHADAIAKYLTNEKKRKQSEADRSPVVG